MTQAHWFAARWRYRADDGMGYADTLQEIEQDLKGGTATVERRIGRKGDYRYELYGTIAHGKIVKAAAKPTVNDLLKQGQRSRDLGRLLDFLADLPQGHHERPGVLRAYEVLKYLPLDYEEEGRRG